MNKTKMAIAVLAAQSMMMSSLPAYSQVLEEVVVTARKKPESLMDAPISVAVVSGAAMDREGITNLEQLSSQVPGLQLGRSAIASSIYIRGIGSAQNSGFEQSAGMYVDGISQVRSRQFTLSMTDIERIEVLRGPQSLLFGKNSIAGAIKVETANPTPGEDFNGYVQADIEPQHETARGTAVLSGSLTDTLAARLALRYSETDGYVDNVYIDRDMQQRDDKIGRLSLVWQPTDALQLVGKVSHINMDGKGTENVNPVADSRLLDETLAGENQLLLFQVLGSIAAFNTPGFTAGTGSRKYKSWTGNLDWAPYDEENTKMTQASLSADWALDNFTVSSLTGYTDFNFTQQIDVDFQPGNVVGGYNNEDVKLFSQEFRIASNFGGRINFNAGIYYEKQDLDISANPAIDGSLGGMLGEIPANALSPLLPAVPLSALGINSAWNGLVLTQLDPAAAPLIGTEQTVIYQDVSNDSNNDTLAVFAELIFELTDTLSLEIGGRYSQDKKKTNKQLSLGAGAPGNQVIAIGSDGLPTGALDEDNTELVGASWAIVNTYPHNQDLTRDEHHFDPTVRLRWDANDDTMIYLSYVEGYKSGGFNATGDTANPDGTPGTGTEFGDENADAWELGLKTSLWDGRARLSTTLFRTKVNDLQVTTFEGLNYIVGNAASSTSQGLEIETQFAVTEEWEVGGSVAYLDSQFDDFENAPCTIEQDAVIGAGCTQDLSGERGPKAPEWSGVIYASYERPVANDLVFRFNVNAGYKDEYFLDSDLDPNTLQDSFTKINARIALAGEDNSWEVALYGRNLTDETTYSSIIDAPLSAGIYGAQIEEPMTIGVQGRYRF